MPVFALVLISLPAWAQQTYFNSKDVGNARLFEYKWRDPDGDHALRFGLSLADIAQAESEFQPFDNTAAQTVAFNAVQSKAKTLSVPNGAEVEVARKIGGYDIRARGVEAPQMQQIADNLKVVRDQALEDYVASRFYSRIDDTHIMPDHRRIAKRYVPAMAPVAQAMSAALGPNADQRATINYVMHFLQSIPYDQLENRYTSNGAGFETPYTILSGNKGDCDSKSVALAATLRAMFPTLKLTMVYVPEHAFVGIGLPQGSADYALRLGGDVFVLADPTGPDFMNLGEVAGRALDALNNGKFSYQEIPF